MFFTKNPNLKKKKKIGWEWGVRRGRLEQVIYLQGIQVKKNWGGGGGWSK